MRRAQVSPLDRVLRLFTDVRAGEGATALLLFANVYLILCAYYFVKPLRDGWIATSPVFGLSKMEVRAYTSFVQGILLLGAMTLYGHLAARWPRHVLIVRTTLFVIANLIVFWLARPGSDLEQPATGILFFIWVGMFGVFAVAQFWAFAADLYSEARGRRLLPAVGIGATAGAATGSYLTSAVLGSGLVDSASLLLVATLPLLGAIGLTLWIDARGPTGEGRDPAERERVAAPPGSSGTVGFVGLLRSHPYLLALAVVTLLTHWVGTNGENVLFRVVQESLEATVASGGAGDPSEAQSFLRNATTAFYGSYFFGVNATALVLQAFVTSRLLKYGGFPLIILLLPSFALVGNVTMAFLPVLGVMRWMKTAENGTSYSVQNTASQVFWLPTSAELKFKAKPAVDTVSQRAGDGFAALTVLLGVNVFAFSVRSFLLVNVSLIGLWFVASVIVARAHRTLVADAPAPEPEVMREAA